MKLRESHLEGLVVVHLDQSFERALVEAIETAGREDQVLLAKGMEPEDAAQADLDLLEAGGGAGRMIGGKEAVKPVEAARIECLAEAPPAVDRAGGWPVVSIPDTELAVHFEAG